MPASAHAQVAVEDDAALEVEQQVLAPALRTLEHTSVDLAGW
jgi:hypothetical protein